MHKQQVTVSSESHSGESFHNQSFELSLHPKVLSRLFDTEEDYYK